MSSQNTSIYARIGGEAGVRELVERFYDLMDSLPEARDIRELHAADLGEAREKLYLFLSGWLGGPPLYVQQYGHPRLRARHLPFSIGIRERDQWMHCMTQAIDAMAIDAATREEMIDAFATMADHMRNRMEEGNPFPIAGG